MSHIMNWDKLIILVSSLQIQYHTDKKCEIKEHNKKVSQALSLIVTIAKEQADDISDLCKQIKALNLHVDYHHTLEEFKPDKPEIDRLMEELSIIDTIVGHNPLLTHMKTSERLEYAIENIEDSLSITRKTTKTRLAEINYRIVQKLSALV